MFLCSLYTKVCTELALCSCSRDLLCYEKCTPSTSSLGSLSSVPRSDTELNSLSSSSEVQSKLEEKPPSEDSLSDSSALFDRYSPAWCSSTCRTASSRLWNLLPALLQSLQVHSSLLATLCRELQCRLKKCSATSASITATKCRRQPASLHLAASSRSAWPGRATAPSACVGRMPCCFQQCRNTSFHRSNPSSHSLHLNSSS